MNRVQQSWSGMIEISNVPSRCASAVISSLSIPTSGRRTGIGRRVDRRHVLERLRGDLPDDFAGDERLGAVAARDGFCDPHHQPAVDHDAERRRDREHDRCWISPNGTRNSRESY